MYASYMSCAYSSTAGHGSVAIAMGVVRINTKIGVPRELFDRKPEHRTPNTRGL